MSNPLAVLAHLEEVRRQTLHYLAGLTQKQLDWRPPQLDSKEVWSLGEIFMHLAIDEFYLRELIALPLLEGIKPPDEVQYLPPPPPYGVPKEVILFWFERARLQTSRLFGDWPCDANLEIKHEGGLHAMNGLEWFAGYGSHEVFHHQQIEQLILQAIEEM
jgi:hypothetical protein